MKNEGRLDEGISLYERALSYVPRHADTLYNLGVAYGEKGDLQVGVLLRDAGGVKWLWGHEPTEEQSTRGRRQSTHQ